MPKSFRSADISVEALQATIDKLRAQERKWRKGGGNAALIKYLASVYRLFTRWKRAGVLDPAVTLVTRLARLKQRRDRHPIRTIIEATSSADRRSASRWTQALRWAWRKQKRWPSLRKCLQTNGGIAGCARRWADFRAEGRVPPGCVRIGGEDRVPKIPLFVDVTMLDRYGNYLPS
jgi:hypothetical protein